MLVIDRYINHQVKATWDSHSKHFYRMPVLNLKIVKRYVTFANPCVLCGEAQGSALHKVVGDARVG